MTHNTGPRLKIVASMVRDIERVLAESGGMVSEAFVALHEVELGMLRKVLDQLDEVRRNT